MSSSLRRLILLALPLVFLVRPAAAAPLGGVVNLPGQVIGGVGQTTSGLRGELGSTVRTVERDVAGRPIVPRIFERDPNGARVLRRTVIALAPTEQDLQAARRLNFDVVRSETLGSLGFTVVQLRAPGDQDLASALATLRSADPAGQFDYDHIYDPSGGDTVRAAGQTGAAPTLVSARDVRIGMIDGGIARRHPVFADASLTLKNVAGDSDGPPTPHGTAIASLLVGSDDEFRGYAAGAKLFAADVYGGQPGGGGAIEIARALDWLAQNDVAVVNISLTGPDNKLLEQVVKRFLARGGVLVAAAGNGGAAAALTYPASYPGVIAVTSVDSRRNLEIDASIGHALFAAPGVDIRAAKVDHGFAKFTGTSFAAPAVTARMALLVTRADPKAAADALQLLRRSAPELPGQGPGLRYVDPSQSQSLSVAQ
ncbi:MAG TPA: S8 family serine peptidase [Rhizomicrobium sp.]|nr:S8 family serine peptidase [Rhizomicrobium sp.]